MHEDWQFEIQKRDLQSPERLVIHFEVEWKFAKNCTSIHLNVKSNVAYLERRN